MSASTVFAGPLKADAKTKRIPAGTTFQLEFLQPVSTFSGGCGDSFVATIINEQSSGTNVILPAGTVSGAPKLRACELICELENNKRGIYGGAIGYIDFTGNLDTCIAIRLAFAKNGKVFVRSGAGIVADSVPENEYQECINKAAAVMNALKMAEGGMDE